MNVIIRTDASDLIGTGHLVRCLTLADYLSGKGANVTFICRDHPGHQSAAVAARGFRVLQLPAPKINDVSFMSVDYQAWLAVPWDRDAEQTATLLEALPEIPDWVVVDHYGLDEKWESRLRKRTKRMLVIDDLANRPHNCDLLLDQNFYVDSERRYDKLVPQRCQRLLGPAYAILRPQFYEMSRRQRSRGGTIRCVLVFYGGVDATGETAKTVRALSRVRPPSVEVAVVAGSGNRSDREIKDLCDASEGFIWHRQVTNMAEMMVRADISFGGGGTTTWERCFLGLPTAAVETAENQRVMLRDLATRRAIWHLGRHDEVSEDTIIKCLEHALESPKEVRQVGRNACAIMGASGTGADCPVVREMLRYR